MRTILSMIGKDLLRKRRAPLGILVMLLFPVAFAGLLALTFGGDDGPPRVHLLLENRDAGWLGQLVSGAMTTERVAEYFDVEVVGPEALERLEAGEGSALLRIPETFTEDVLAGRPTTFELVRNPAQGILPEVAEQAAGVLTEVLSAAARVLREPLREIDAATGSGSPPADSEVAAIAIQVNRTLGRAGDLLFPPAIQVESVRAGAAPGEPSSGPPTGASIFLFVFPGVAVWSLFMIGDAAMRDILTENDAGTLRRQLSGPIGTGKLILAKAGFTAVVATISFVLLALIGGLAGGRPHDVPGFVALSLALVVAVTGAGATVYGAAGTQRRGSTVAALVYLLLGFTGGTFLPLESLPEVVRSIAPLSPFYWGANGYRALLDEGDPGVVLQAVAVLSALGAVLLATGSALLRRRVLRGIAA